MNSQSKLQSETQELNSEIEMMQKEEKALEARMADVKRRENQLQEWQQAFEEESKRWGEAGAISRELFVSTLSSL